MNYLRNELYQLIKQDDAVFDFIQHSALDGLWYWDLENIEEEWMNETFWTTLGYDPKEMPHKSSAWQGIINPNDLKKVVKNIERHLSDPDFPYDQVVRYRHKKGHNVWIRSRGLAIKDADGNPIRMLGAHTDVTAAMKRRELLERCNTEAKIGYWEVDLSTMLPHWSDETCRIHGEEPGFAPNLEDAINYYVEGENRSRVTRDFEEAVQNGISFEGTYLIQRADGKQAWVKSIGIPEMHEGKCVRIYGTFQDIDEQKKTADQLSTNERKLRTIFNSSDSLILLTDAQGFVTDANKALLEAMQINLEDIQGKGVCKAPELKWNRSHQEDVARLMHLVFQGEKIEDAQLSWVSDGQHETIVLSIHPIFDNEGNLLQTLFEARPIQSYIDINQRYRSIIDATQSGTWEWNMQTDEVTINEYWAAMFGYTVEELAPINGQIWARLCHPDDQTRAQEGLNNCYLGKTDYFDFQGRFIHKKGHSIWISTKGKVNSRTEDGKALMIYGVNTDITSMMETQKELERVEGRRKSLMQASTKVAMFSTDLKGNIVDFNSGAENMLGYKANEIVHQHSPAIWHDPQEIKNRKRELLELGIEIPNDFEVFVWYARKGSPETREWTYIKKNGERTKVQLTVSGVYEENDLIGFLGVATDISRLKKAEKASQEMLELSQQQNDRLRNFAHIVSHNLRSHGSGISGLLELIEIENPEMKDHHLIKLLNNASNNLKETLQDLSDVVKVHIDEQKETKAIKIGHVVEQTIESLFSQAEKEQIQIINEVGSDDLVLGIPLYVKSVILNLITNAIKYRSNQRNSYIKIYTSKIDVTKQLQIHVEDNGLGIDLDKYGDRLFGMYKTFHQHSDSRGVGLFITKNQVESMGGRISVKSTPDVGSTFTITLPYES